LVQHYGLKKKVTVQPNPVSTPTNELYRVQVGAFSVKNNADKLAAELKSKGYSVIVVEA
jgi:N-acetylmuramoyl-L-alanine amidase